MFCSDPRTIHSTVASDRGAGVFFGPDVTERFCALNGISLVVRSHECVPEGAFLLRIPADVGLKSGSEFSPTAFSIMSYRIHVYARQQVADCL